MKNLDSVNIIPSNKDYILFFRDIKWLIVNRKNNALKAVNSELIWLNWELWRFIVEKQEKANWWDWIIKQLSEDLEKEFWKWFSRTNLLYIRKFYLTYKDDIKVHTLYGQISWSHNKAILDKCNIDDDKNDLRRLFYMKMSISQRWSFRDLKLNIEQHLFEKWALKQTNFKQNLPENLQSDASILVKDSYDFSFLNLENSFKESKLEDLMVKSIEKTLKNFWTYFSFIWRQVKIEIWWQDFFIDLLFYNRKIKSFVAIELKIGDFKAEYSGKMNMYLSALETQENLEWENSPIWIILCKSKNKTIVEYALMDTNKPMWVASYITQENLPEELKNILPEKDEILREIEILES